MQPRISMISLGVVDIEASINFYAEGLELPRMAPFNEEIAFFNLNGTWLSLYPWDKLAEDAQVPSQQGPCGHPYRAGSKTRRKADQTTGNGFLGWLFWLLRRSR
jgi:hypothetical protein